MQYNIIFIKSNCYKRSRTSFVFLFPFSRPSKRVYCRRSQVVITSSYHKQFYNKKLSQVVITSSSHIFLTLLTLLTFSLFGSFRFFILLDSSCTGNTTGRVLMLGENDTRLIYHESQDCVDQPLGTHV